MHGHKRRWSNQNVSDRTGQFNFEIRAQSVFGTLFTKSIFIYRSVKRKYAWILCELYIYIYILTYNNIQKTFLLKLSNSSLLREQQKNVSPKSSAHIQRGLRVGKGSFLKLFRVMLGRAALLNSVCFDENASTTPTRPWSLMWTHPKVSQRKLILKWSLKEKDRYLSYYNFILEILYNKTTIRFLF